MKSIPANLASSNFGWNIPDRYKL